MSAISDLLPTQVSNSLPDLSSLVPNKETLGNLGSALGLGGGKKAGKGPAGFNVSNFRSSALSKGLSKPAYFYVNIPRPKLVSQAFDSHYFCEAAQLPGTVINTISNKRYGKGPAISYPISIQYNQIPMTFIVDAKGTSLKFFTQWQQAIINVDTSKTMAESFDISYQSDYTVSINIITSSDTGDAISQYTLWDAYPVVVSDVALAWIDSDQYMKVTVIFQYSTFTNNFMEPAKLKGAGSDLLANLTRLGSLAQVVSNLKSPNSFGNIISDFNSATTAIKAF